MFGGFFSQKKGTVESLFRFGHESGGDHEDKPAPAHMADQPEDSASKHEVYTVRGRPFIAAVPGKGTKPKAGRSTPGAGRSSPEWEMVQAPVQTPAVEPGRARPPPGPSTRASSAARKASPPPRQRASKGSATSLAAGANKIREEEWAALFRNNLLRSCWKPGLKNEEVQHILTLWERKLVEVMHRWTHPEIWVGFKRWKRRTWKLDRLQFIINRARHFKERKAWDAWTAFARARLVTPFMDQQIMQRKLRLWHRRAIPRARVSRVINSFRKKSPFMQLKKRTTDGAEKRRYLKMLAAGFYKKGEKKVINKWVEFTQERLEMLVIASRAASGLRGPYRKVWNTWLGRLQDQGPMRAVYNRWMNATMNALFRRWAYEFREKMAKFRNGLGHWLKQAESKAFNKLQACLKMYYIALNAAKRLHQGKLNKGFNTWFAFVAAAAAWRAQVGAIFGTLGGSKMRAGFNGWRAKHEANSKLGNPKARAAAHWLNRHLSRAYVHWQTITSLMKRLEIAMFRLRNASLVKAMNAMVENAKEMMERKRRLQSALNEMQGKGCRRGWWAWREETDARMERNRRIRNALAEMSGKGYRKAWWALLEMMTTMMAMRKAVAAVLYARERRALTTLMRRVEEAAAATDAKSKVVSVMRGCKKVFDKIKEEMEKQRKLRRGLGGLVNGPKLKAMNKWAEDTRLAMERMRRLRGALAEMQGAGCRRGWFSWQEYAAYKAKMFNSLSKMANSVLNRGFGTWVEWLLEKQEREEKVRAALERMSPEGRAKSGALNSWLEMCAEKALMLRASAHIANKPMSNGFNSWVEFTEERLANFMLLQRAAGGLTSKLLAGFNGWIEYLEGGDDLGSRAIKHMMNRGLSKGWTSWWAEVELRMKKAAAMQRLINRSLSKGFESWQAMAEEEAYKKQKTAGALARMSPEGRKKSAALNVLKEAGETRRRMRRALSSLMNTGKKKVMNTLSERVAEHKAKLAKLRNCAAALGGKKTFLAIRTWKAHIDEPDHLSRAMARWANSALTGALLGWKAGHANMMTMKRGLMGMISGKLRMGYNSWHSFAEEKKAKEAYIKQALARMTHPCAKGLMAWKDRVFGGRDDPMSKALAYFRNRKISPAWNKWHAIFKEFMRIKFAMAGFVSGPLKRAMTTWRVIAEAGAAKMRKIKGVLAGFSSPEGRAKRAATNSWKEMWYEMKLMRKAAARVANSGILKGFNGWNAFVVEKKEKLARAQAAMKRMTPEGRAMTKAMNQLHHAMEMHRLLLRATSGFTNRASRGAYNKWTSVVEQTEKIRVALARAANGRLLRALLTWRDRPQYTPLERSAKHLMNRHLSAAWVTWVDICLSKSAAYRALAHLRDRNLSKGWFSWLDFVESMLIMRRGALSMLNGKLKKGFNGWYAYVEERLEKLARLQAAVASMVNGALKRGFNNLAELLDRPADPRARAAAHFANRELSKAFISWVEETARWLVMLNALSGLRNREVKKGMNGWVEYAAERKAKLEKTRAALKSLSPEGRAMRKAINQWAGVLKLLAPMRAALIRMSMRNQSKAFESWEALVAEKARMRNLMAGFRNDPRLRAVRQWRFVAEGQKARLQKLEAKARRMVQGPSVKALNKMKELGAQFGKIKKVAKAMLNSRLKKGWNTFYAAWVAAVEAREKIEAAMKRMSPEGRAMTKGINAWRETVEFLAKQKAGLMRMMNRKQSMCFESWQAFAQEGVEQRARMAGALRKMSPEGRKKSAAINTMREALEVYYTMKRAAAAILYRHSRKALNNWHSVVEQQHRIRETLYRVMNSKLVKAFNNWRQAPPHPARKAIKRLTQGPLTKALNSWISRYEETLFARRSLLHFINRELSKGFRGWEEYMREMMVMLRGAQGFRNGAILKGLNSMAEFAAERREKLAFLERSLGAMRNGGLKRGFNVLAELLDAPPDPRAKALAHLMNKELSRGIVGWIAFFEERKRLSATLKRMMGQEDDAFNAWKEWYNDRIEWLENAERTMRALSPEGRAKRKTMNTLKHLLELLGPVRGALNRLKYRNVSKAFEKWQANLEEWYLMKKAAASILHGPASRAMGAWKELVAQANEKKSLMKKAIMRTSPRGKAFSKWMYLTQATYPLRKALGHWGSMQIVKGMRSWEEYRAARLLMRRAGAAMFNRKLMTGMNSWNAFVVEKKEKLARAQAAMKRMSPEGRAMTKGINMWKEMMEEIAILRRGAAAFSGKAAPMNKWKDFLAESQRMKAMLFRAMNRALAKAFAKWRTAGDKSPLVSDKNRARLAGDPRAVAFDTWFAGMASYWLLRKSMGHLKNREISKGYRAWIAYGEAMQLMAMAAKRMANQAIVRGMNAWGAWYEEKLEKQRKVAGALNSLRSPLRKVINTWAQILEGPGLRERALRRLANTNLLKGWNSFIEMKEELEKKRRAMAHLMGQEYVKVWNSWGEFLLEQAKKRKALAQFVHGSEARCVRKWVEHVFEKKEKMRRMGIVMAKLNSKVDDALNTWKEFIEELMMKRKSLARLVYASQWKALNKMVAHAQESAEMRARQAAIIKRMTSPTCKALNRWLELVEEKRMMRKALGPFRHRATYKAIHKWFEFISQRMELYHKASTMASALTSGVVKAMNAWVDLYLQLFPLKRAVGHFLHSGLARGVSAWCDYCVWINKQQTAMFRLFNRQLSKGFESWQAWVEENDYKRFILYRALNQAVLRALRRWAGSAAEREEKMRIMAGTIRKMTSPCLKAFNCFKALLASRARMAKAMTRFARQAEVKVINKWIDRVVKANAVKLKLRQVMMHRQKKAIRGWYETVKGTSHAHKAIKRWKNSAYSRAMNHWKEMVLKMNLAKRAVSFLLNRNLAKGINSWLARMAEFDSMRRSFGAFFHSATKKVLNTWVSYLEERDAMRARMLAAARIMVDARIKRCVNTWRGVADKLKPLKAGLGKWMNPAMNKALNKLAAVTQKALFIRAQLHRIRHSKATACINTWKAKMKALRRKKSYGTRLTAHGRKQTAAINTWKEFMEQRRRLRQAAAGFNPKRNCFAYWKNQVVKQPSPAKPASPLGPRVMIKAMTWRECCSWLNQQGIRVSRSPPTLLRALKEGGVYIELVHRISPAYYVRHKVERCQETCGVFMMVQAFFDSDLVISIVGCQKIDVLALRAGKAREHLDLIETLKTILTAVRRAEAYQDDE